MPIRRLKGETRLRNELEGPAQQLQTQRVAPPLTIDSHPSILTHVFCSLLDLFNTLTDL